MKIQSRPPQKLKSEMTPEEIAVHLRDVINAEGVSEGTLYRLVLTLGALAGLKRLDVIVDYQAREKMAFGSYGIWAQVRTPDGECHDIGL